MAQGHVNLIDGLVILFFLRKITVLRLIVFDCFYILKFDFKAITPKSKISFFAVHFSTVVTRKQKFFFACFFWALSVSSTRSQTFSNQIIMKTFETRIIFSPKKKKKKTWSALIFFFFKFVYGSGSVCVLDDLNAAGMRDSKFFFLLVQWNLFDVILNKNATSVSLPQTRAYFFVRLLLWATIVLWYAKF